MNKKQQRQQKMLRQQEIVNAAKEAGRDLTAEEQTEFLFIAIIIHMLALAIIRMPDYNYTDMICRKDLGVMEYMSCPEAAKKWGISERRVQVLCRENRIPGVSKLGYMWLIPKDAEKPIDGRTKQGKELHHE